jgi:N-methylhydantoinase B/oxoprolinase/acetone carboxylase alpha subunit
MFGGYSAAPSILIHVKDSRVKKMLADGRAPEDLDDLGGEKIHVGYCEVEVKSGDVAYIRHASGGGYGDPLERDPQSVREDVVNELVSREAARAVYGVAVSGEGVALDRDSTAALRERYRQERIEGSL